jgi:FAD/FMN-containing dehydrogenase
MIDSLRAAFSGKLLTHGDDTTPFLIDWRKTWRGSAIAVAIPDSVEDVAKVVRWCAANDVSITPQGGNTSQSGGSVPPTEGRNLLLSLTRLNTIRKVDARNNTMIVEAGVILQHVQEAANDVDRFFPLSLGAEGSCTIGGNLATNAGGTAVLRYGNARDLCLGLEVVTAKGDIWDGLKALRKDNSGYDLRDLFIGSEGTLGVITAAVIKLFPKPAARLVAWAGVKNSAQAMCLFEAIRAQRDMALTAFELVSATCLDLVLNHCPDLRDPLRSRHAWYVLVEFTDLDSEENARLMLEQSLAEALENGWIEDVVIAETIAQSRALWQLRERISQAQGAEGKAIKHDIAVPISSISVFIEEGLAEVEAAFPDVRPVIFGHLGDGNLHYNFSSARGADQGAFWETQSRINAIVHQKVRAFGGTISAEHGLGVLRRDEVHAHRSPVERRLMSSVKHALDPQGIMNPGKMLG